MYWERQRGNLCRLHSLNAFFGEKYIDDNKFKHLCEKYDEIVPGLKTDDMDGFSQGRCIINWILYLHGYHSVLIPINKFNNRQYIDLEHYKHIVNENKVNSIFEFNEKHVWINKKNEKNKWHKLDSITGITPIDMQLNNNGYIIVFHSIKSILNELDFYLNSIKKSSGSLNETNEIIWYNLAFALNLFKTKNPLINSIKKLSLGFIWNKEKKEYCQKIIQIIKSNS